MRKEQSEEVLDLRMSCLQERLAGLRALTDVFADEAAEVVDHAAGGANALAPLERCAGPCRAGAVVEQCRTIRRRGRRSPRCAPGLSELKARLDAGKFEGLR